MSDRKEALWAMLDARDSTIAALRDEVAHQQAVLADRESVIATLDAAVKRSVGPEKTLADKEAVIKELSAALESYRTAFAFFGFILVPVGRLMVKVRASLRRFVGPYLGNLSQHEPRSLCLPDSYSKPAVLARAPRVSIVTPSFRQSAFIERTLKSVLDQNYPNLDYHVQDGASEDGTKEILRRYADRLSSWESRADHGQAEAINLGFQRSDGEIMAYLNSDDVLLPGALAYVVDYFNRHPGVDVVYGHRLLIDESDRLVGRWIMPAHDNQVLSWADFVPQETLFWRRGIWEKAGGRIDESFRFALDWDLLIRFRDAGARFARLPRLLGGFRIHERQKTSSAISNTGFVEMERIRERVLGRVPTASEVRRAVTPYLLRHIVSDMRWRITTLLHFG